MIMAVIDMMVMMVWIVTRPSLRPPIPEEQPLCCIAHCFLFRQYSFSLQKYNKIIIFILCGFYEKW